ncbi:MAG: RNA polymerase sigma factor [Caldisericia bacterium]|nr:RNA polymerase sigma factor [Caldisericia bacterium]
MDLKEEKKLIKQAQKNPEIFTKLYEEYYSKIFNYILKRVANIEIAQDITSETFFNALKKLNKFKWQNISFSAWLYRIANNEIVNYYRKNKHYISLEKLKDEKGFEPIVLHNPEKEFLEAQEKLKKYVDFLEIQDKINKLPIKYQEVIMLRFFEKKEIKEICEILGKKEGTVKSLIHRGLEKLRDLL